MLLDTGAGGWLYKRNLSPDPATAPGLALRARSRRAGRRASRRHAHRRWIDLAGDGQPDLVELGSAPGRASTHATRTAAGSRSAFTTSPKLDFDGNPNLQLVDLTGDGLPDILVTEDDVRALAPVAARAGLRRRGAGVARRARRGGRTRVLLADSTETIYLADMSAATA